MKIMMLISLLMLSIMTSSCSNDSTLRDMINVANATNDCLSFSLNTNDVKLGKYVFCREQDFKKQTTTKECNLDEVYDSILNKP